MFEKIRELNIDLVIGGVTFLSTIYLLIKQFPHLKVSKIICNYYVDEFDMDENGNYAIELLPHIKIVNKSQNPISIYSIEVSFKNKHAIFTRRISFEKVKEIIFHDNNEYSIKYSNIIDGRSVIELGQYQPLIGFLDNWIHADESDLIDGKIVIQTTRGKIKKKIHSFKKIDSSKIRSEEY